jgi:hypothetical protein
MKKMFTALAVVALALTGFVWSTAEANPHDKVGVCHRTASETNPYVYIEVPADEANGHITGTGKQHNENVYWKSAGTWRGVDHLAGDIKLDYYANSRSDCEDTVVEPTPDPTPTPPVVTEAPDPVINEPPVITDKPKHKSHKNEVVIPTVVHAGL